MTGYRNFAFASMLTMLCATAAPHSIELGYARVPAACSVSNKVNTCVLGIFCFGSTVERRVDQRTKITAVILPNRPIEGREHNSTLVSCATQTSTKLGLDNLAQEGVTPESDFQEKLNACLAQEGAPFRAESLLLRREKEPCPSDPVMTVPTSTPMQDPPLISVTVSFDLPKCDDKDHDSSFDITIVKDGVVLAEGRGIGRGQVFRDPSRVGPFPLVLKNAATKAGFVESVTRVHLNTVGKDTVCTYIIVDSLFADNSKGSARTCSLTKISEVNRSTEFGNKACP